MAKTGAKAQLAHGRLMVPNDSFSLEYQGVSYTFVPGDMKSIVEEGHPILKGREHLFNVLVPALPSDGDHERWETATAAPGEVRGA